MRHIVNLAYGLVWGLLAFVWAEMLSDIWMVYTWFRD